VATVLLELPEALRSELKDPMGPIHTDAEAMLSDADGPLVAVGDVVTYHILQAGRVPEVALVDERTEREPVEAEIWDAIGGFDRTLEVENPAATLTEQLLAAIQTGLQGEETTLVTVDGEEDLATLPAILVAPVGASVVYGQPGEGMVLVTVDEQSKATVRRLLEAMAGDHAGAFRALGVDPS
jgi:uncharacterized protein (UPF0218 family)